MALARGGLLPLVIDRDLRVEYVGALESADLGSLAPLADMFARLERNATLQALSVDTDRETKSERNLTSAVIGSLEDKVEKRLIEKSTDLRLVNDFAIQFRVQAERLLTEYFERVKATLARLGETP